jgi:Zn-dependent oligopeptidase
MKSFIIKTNLEKEYSLNTIWENAILFNFRNTSFWENEIDKFILFLKKEIEEVISNPTSIKNTYFRIKKVVCVLKYLSNYFATYNQIHTHKLIDLKSFLNDSQLKMDNLCYDIRCNTQIYSKFQLLLTSNIGRKKEIIKSWLEKFFQENQPPELKKNYKKISGNLHKHINTFRTNNQELNSTKNDAVFISSDKANWIEGIPLEIITEAKIKAIDEDMDGWLFYLNESITIKILKEAKYPLMRQKIYNKFQKINKFGRFTFENAQILKNILMEKHKISKLMGKTNYAELVLSKYILDTPQKAYDYLEEIEATLLPKIQKINPQIIELAKKDGISTINGWDIHYYFKKIQDKLNPVPEDDFENYFIFDEVVPKILTYFEQQFNIKIVKERFDNVGNKEILRYRITDNKSKRHGIFLVSPWDNSSKPFCSQLDQLKSDTLSDGFCLPNIQLIELQFEKTNKEKSPIGFSDLVTFIHEFGHAFHSFFESNVDHIHKNLHLSCDLIEMPSQFLEHLVYDYDFIKSISKHNLTGKKINEKEFLSVIQHQQYLDSYYIYCDIQKYKAQLSVHEQFQPYSFKNIQELIEINLSQKGIVYNIAQDQYMTYDDYNFDYGPTGYIYLYSALLGFQLFQQQKTNSKRNLRYIYTNIFNSRKQTYLKQHLNRFINLEHNDINAFIQKELPISIY